MSEFLSTACFHYGKYGHVKEGCHLRNTETIHYKGPKSLDSLPETTDMAIDGKSENSDTYDPWILVDRRNRCKSHELPQL